MVEQHAFKPTRNIVILILALTALVVLCCCVTSSVGGYLYTNRTASVSSTTAPDDNTQAPPAPTSVVTTPPKTCKVDACNAAMKDYIVNKYWAFDDSGKNMTECANCASRWFKAPFMTSTNGKDWKSNVSKDIAFADVKLG